MRPIALDMGKEFQQLGRILGTLCCFHEADEIQVHEICVWILRRCPGHRRVAALHKTEFHRSGNVEIARLHDVSASQRYFEILRMGFIANPYGSGLHHR